MIPHRPPLTKCVGVSSVACEYLSYNTSKSDRASSLRYSHLYDICLRVRFCVWTTVDFTTHTPMRSCLLGHSLESELSSLLPTGPRCGAYGLVWVRGQGGVLARDVRSVKIDFFMLHVQGNPIENLFGTGALKSLGESRRSFAKSQRRNGALIGREVRSDCLIGLQSLAKFCSTSCAKICYVTKSAA
jgi:hypothetical protein